VNHGKIVQVGTPRDIYERPKDRFVATFIGESSLVPVNIAGGAVSFGTQPLKVGLSATLNGAAAGHLVLRPERLQILSTPQDDELNCLPATIRNAIYQGDSTFICTTLGDGTELFIRRPLHRQAPEVPEPGSAVFVAFHPDDGIVVPDAP
jgi:putative spermidine/putrescine transport system ATP-binding protein